MEVERDRSLETTLAYQRRRANEAEEEANTRILQARKKVIDENQKATKEIEKVREDFSKNIDYERSRMDTALQIQHDKSYENLLEQKRKLDSELGRMKRVSDKNIFDTKIQYETEKTKLERDGKKEVSEIIEKNKNQKEFEIKTGEAQINEVKTKQFLENDFLINSHKEKTTQLNESQEKKLSDLKQNYIKTMENTNEHYESNFKKIHEDQSQVLGKIGKTAKTQLEEVRLSTSSKLNQYKSRQDDPFYKLIDLGIKLTEDKDQFTLIAKIPEHEQNKIQVNVRGNELFLNGTRSNKEKIELAPGHSRATSSQQTFHETIPLTYPVNAKALTRRFEGDLLIVDIPKMTASFDPNQMDTRGKVTKEDEVYAVRPAFPENLPGQKELVAKLQEMKSNPKTSE